MMTDDEVLAAVHAFVEADAERDFTDWTAVTMRLPEPIRVYHLTWLVEAEVGSGGFVHFFRNFWGGLSGEAVRCYQLLGAPRHADLVARAAAIHGATPSEEELVDQLDILDDELYALATAEPTDGLRRQFLEPHLALLSLVP